MPAAYIPIDEMTDDDYKGPDRRRQSRQGDDTRSIALELANAQAERERAAAEQRQELAVRLAYDRGQSDKALEARLDGFGRNFKDYNGQIREMGRELHGLSEQVAAVVKVVGEMNAVKVAQATWAGWQLTIVQKRLAILMAVIGFIALILTGQGALFSIGGK